MTLYGPDGSSFQRNLNIDQVKAEGFDFVFWKVSEGDYYQDTSWPRVRDAARANGLLLSGYHYVRGDVDPNSQADTFVQQLGDNSIPVMLDFEANGGNIDSFWAVLNAIQARGPRVRLSYVPHWYWSQIGSPDISGVPGLIQSAYVSGSGYASALYAGDQTSGWNGFGGRNPDLLQFTDAAALAGVNMDCNAFRGSRDDLAALLGVGAPPPPAPPVNAAPEVHGAIADYYNNTPGLAALLGAPVTPESPCPDGIGRYNHFQNGGSIYWTPDSGAHVVFGAIRDKWSSMGWERSPLGYPVSDEFDAGGGFRVSLFEHGYIDWSASRGALEHF